MIYVDLVKMGLIEKDLIETDSISKESMEMDIIEERELDCEEKSKQAIRKSPWKIYYVKGVCRNKYGTIKECVESDPNNYQYAALRLKSKNVDIAIFFLEQGGSFSLISKHLRNIKNLE